MTTEPAKQSRIMNEFPGIEKLKISASVNVSIVKGPVLKVTPKGDKANEVKTTRTGNELSVEYKEEGIGSYTVVSGRGNFISIGGGSFTQINSGGKSVSIVGGKVFVDGHEVGGDGKPCPQEEMTSIEIQCPDGLSIECDLDGAAILNASPSFNWARLALAGDASVDIQSRAAKIRISGAGRVAWKALGGSATLNISGSGRVQATGTFQDIDASVSGSGRVSTMGTVSGDYDAGVSGSGSISHSGSIQGGKSRSVSGSGSVSFN